MKKIIIIAIATLSTGVVLSSSLKKNDNALPVEQNKQLVRQQKSANESKTNSLDEMATAD